MHITRLTCIATTIQAQLAGQPPSEEEKMLMLYALYLQSGLRLQTARSRLQDYCNSPPSSNIRLFHTQNELSFRIEKAAALHNRILRQCRTQTIRLFNKYHQLQNPPTVASQ